MTFFNKLFSSSRKKNANANLRQNNSSPRFPFNSDQVRILLYRECDVNGRKLLFDSNSIKRLVINDFKNHNIKLNLQTSKSKLFCNLKKKATEKDYSSNDGIFVKIQNGLGYKQIRNTASDTSNIGEMVFGALAMSFCSPSLKVHWMQAPNRLLCSQVFLSPIPSSNICRFLNQKNLIGNNIKSENLNSEQKFRTKSVESFERSSVRPSQSDFELNFELGLKVPTLSVHDLLAVQTTIDKTKIQFSENTTSIIGSDSGYATLSERFTSNSSYQCSTRSSIGSVLSDQSLSHEYDTSLNLDNGNSNFNEIDNARKDYEWQNFTSSIPVSQVVKRRISRNLETSFENHNSICDLVGYISDNFEAIKQKSQSDSCVTQRDKIRKNTNQNENYSYPEIRLGRSTSNVNMSVPSINSSKKKSKFKNTKRSKLGIAVCISLTESHEKEMEEFCCQHIALFESMLSRLRASTEYAYLNHKRFLKIMVNVWETTIEWITDFFTAPRLSIPIWYNFTCLESKVAAEISENFVKEFCWLLKKSDSKETNFTLITAVLTHHLGWIETIKQNSSKLFKSISRPRKKMELKSKNVFKYSSEFYNPLWAQMCNLYGAIGYPSRVSRTIVFGQDKVFVEKCLNIISYFIRCGKINCNNIDVESNNDLIHKNTIKHLSNDNNMLTPKQKENLRRNVGIQNNLCEDFPDGMKNILKSNNHEHKQNFSKQKYLEEINKFESLENFNFKVTTPEELDIAFGEKLSSKNSIATIIDNYEVLEAIEIKESLDSNDIPNFEIPNVNEKLKFWNFKPMVKDGLSLESIENVQGKKNIVSKSLKNWSNSEIANQTDFKILDGEYIPYSNKEEISLSNLKTENSIGVSERFIWDGETIKRNICLEEEKHFEVSQNRINNDNNYINNKNEIVNKEKGKGVLFVLGENEHLVNIKKSIQQLSAEKLINSKKKIEKANKCIGVKFNLKDYSENVTNFLYEEKCMEIKRNILKNNLKSENILTNDFWIKCTCDNNNLALKTKSSFDLKNSSELSLNKSKTFLYPCDFCTTKDANKISVNSQIHSFKNNGSKEQASFARLVFNSNITAKNEGKISIPGLQTKTKFKDLKQKKKSNSHLNLIYVPLQKVDKEFCFEENAETKRINAGFVPSLFIGITERYISDMVLQGVSLPISKWETNIKNDLIIASNCASLTSKRNENVAIIVNTDEWEIKLISSQNVISYTSSLQGPVGMSHLVSHILDGLYIMATSGISAFECLEYLETKLNEIYLQSETLAALLLSTEFCSLNTITAALNLSENDVPLLLAVASTHSPEVTKIYGISFG